MSDVFQMVPVRPELAKIRHFGQILKVVDNFRALFSACQYISPTLAKPPIMGVAESTQHFSERRKEAELATLLMIFIVVIHRM